MDIKITLKSKDALEWFKSLLDRSLNDPNSHAASIAYDHMVEWREALEAAEFIREASKTVPQRSKPKRRTVKPQVDKSGLVCNSHPNYGGVRPPRKDCDECWSVYKKFHPMEFKQKRAAFVRKMKDSEN